MNKVKNILYLGWLGEGNVGDDVLFEIFKQKFYENLKREDSNVEYNIDGYFSIPNYHYTLEPYDLVVLGGGSLFHLPYWLRLCKKAIELNIPVVSWGTGIDGYFTEKDFRKSTMSSDTKELLLEVTSKMDYISVRGPITKKLMIDCGVDESKIRVIGDPALIYGQDGNLKVGNKKGSKKVLVNWGTSNNNILGGDEKVVREQMEITLQILLNWGYNVTLYPIWKDDISSIRRLLSKFTSDNLTAIQEVYDAKRLTKLIDNYDLTINFKLHANILSVARHKPFISLAYRGKCFDFTESINSSNFAISTAEVNAGKILKRVEQIEENYKNIVNSFVKMQEKYASEIQQSFEKIYQLLSDNQNRMNEYQRFIERINARKNNKKFIIDRYSPKKIFVLGSGRSGTHWLGYILETHPDIYVSVEKPIIFDKVTQMALNSDYQQILFPKVVDLYHNEHAKVFPKHYADKSHPNIWIAEKLAKAFPEALFIGIQRNPFGTIASMFKHQGVLNWHKKWKDFPIPNPFLGITKKNVHKYEQLSLAKKCAFRWDAHREKMNELKSTLGDRLHVVSYEALITDTQKELNLIQNFLKLEKPLPLPKVNKHSLDKWREQLTQRDILDIKEVTGYDPENSVLTNITNNK
ncbi:polysaccharide pyruvyl transferase family protein [Oceanobacillus salinisoli]|uniref:polysaccharide pyruvyl transferase family protein n=1 Tax=Oceanobacillus salinisoli TaxID=2678611 RepID=UPI0012E2C237|nr:polysaccharide pyruvyl transferase family protein [Oceanobacillus salinisoli]